MESKIFDLLPERFLLKLVVGLKFLRSNIYPSLLLVTNVISHTDLVNTLIDVSEHIDRLKLLFCHLSFFSARFCTSENSFGSNTGEFVRLLNSLTHFYVAV